MDDTTDIPTEGITTHTAITGTTIGTGVGLSASTGAQVITGIGKLGVRFALRLPSSPAC
jgi:hypothetical protein